MHLHCSRNGTTMSKAKLLKVILFLVLQVHPNAECYSLYGNTKMKEKRIDKLTRLSYIYSS